MQHPWIAQGAVSAAPRLRLWNPSDTCHHHQGASGPRQSQVQPALQSRCSCTTACSSAQRSDTHVPCPGQQSWTPAERCLSSFMCAISWFPQQVQDQTEEVFETADLVYLDQKTPFEETIYFFHVVLDFCRCCTVILFNQKNGKHLALSWNSRSHNFFPLIKTSDEEAHYRSGSSTWWKRRKKRKKPKTSHRWRPWVMSAQSEWRLCAPA